MPTDNLLKRLGKKAQRGSKPRCHLLMHGGRESVAQRLTGLIKPWGKVGPADKWMPNGFDDVKEVRLDKANDLLPSDVRQTLRNWWLKVTSGNPNTPNWDIASTCTINGKPGLLLIEAKAHDEELRKEEKGKELRASASDGSRRNHRRIGKCIEEASAVLAKDTKLPWGLSRDRNYQISNRFAWSWKLTELGSSVIMMYLGFLKAEEMDDMGRPFADQEEWQALVKLHGSSLVPSEVWNRKWTVNGQTFIPLIRAIEQPLACP